MAIDLTARLRLVDQFSNNFRKLERQLDRAERAFRSTETTADRYDRAVRNTSASSRALSTNGKLTASSIDDVGRSAKKATNDINRLDRSMKRAGDGGGGLFGGFSAGDFAYIVGGFRSVASTVGNMFRRAIRNALIAGTAAIGGASYLSTRALGLAAADEQARIAYSTLIGDEARANQFIADLERFAVFTPFEMPDLRDSSRRLLAFGFSVDDVLPALEALGNASAGLGLGTEGINRLALALGQIRAKGRLQGEEALQLAEAGIPVYDILAEKMGATTAEVVDMMSKGIIPAQDAIYTLIDGMNRRFPKMMEKQSQTLDGLWATIQDTFNIRILQSWGEGLADAIRPRLKRITDWFDNNEATVAKWGESLRKTAQQVGDFLATQFEAAFNFIRTRYLENPEFNDLDFTGKVQFIVDDIAAKLNEWLDGGGREKLKKFAGTVGELIGDGLAMAAPYLADLAWNMGSSFARGFLNGVNEGIGDSFFGWSPARKGEKNRERLIGFIEKNEQTPDDVPAYGSGELIELPQKGWFSRTLDKIDRTLRPHKFPSHAGGLNRVPYDGYTARLHKNEAVLTAEEARKYRNSGGNISSGGVTITGNTFNVREESDIKKIASELVTMINQAAANGA